MIRIASATATAVLLLLSGAGSTPAVPVQPVTCVQYEDGWQVCSDGSVSVWDAGRVAQS